MRLFINEVFSMFFCGSNWSSGRMLDFRIGVPQFETWALTLMLFYFGWHFQNDRGCDYLSMRFFLCFSVDRIGQAVYFSTSESEVPSSNPGYWCQCCFVYIWHFQNNRRCGYLSMRFFLAFSVDRIGQVVDFSTSELEVPSSNPGQWYQCCFVYIWHFQHERGCRY